VPTTRGLRPGGKATKQATRQANLRLVLQAILHAESTSRADLSRETGLTRPAISDLVAELIDDGLVVEAGQGVSAGGKPPTLLQIDATGRHIIALDLSGETFRGHVADLRGDVVHAEEIGVDGDGEQAVSAVRQLVERLLAASSGPVLGVGIATPGVVTAEGVVVEAANLGWHGLPLADLLRSQLDVPVHVVNDAQASAVDEFGRDRTLDNLVAVRIGRGIGAGIVVDGHVARGDRHAAGEIGHVEAVPDGLACRCGRRGCLETVASIPAMLRALGAEASDDLDTVRRAFTGSDAVPVLATAATHLGRALATVVSVLDVRRVVLGGTVEVLGDAFRSAVTEALQARVLPALAGDLDVRFSSGGERAVLDGAWATVVAAELGVMRR
jgi:predicted NBD/HSP70 family sugar kinase/biotin operon repressor